jgi:hypothetical protein
MAEFSQMCANFWPAYSRFDLRCFRLLVNERVKLVATQALQLELLPEASLSNFASKVCQIGELLVARFVSTVTG